jgi:ribosome-binding factor A
MSIAKHKHEGMERRLFEALENWFLNELESDVAESAMLTRLELTTDRKHLNVFYAPIGDGAEEDGDGVASWVEDELEGLVYAMGDVVEEELHGRRPEIRLKLDKGARNAARVESILNELHLEDGGTAEDEGKDAGS